MFKLLLFNKLIKKSLAYISKFRFFLQYKNFKKKNIKRKCNFVPSQKINDIKNVVIIVPHADDEIIGCHTFLINKRIDCKIFYCGYTGSNNNPNNANIRKSELLEVCNIYNISNPIIGNNKCNDIQISDTIENYKPELILLPNFLDWHTEHREVNLIIRGILQQKHTKPLIGSYQVSIPISSSVVTHLIPMNKKQQKTKWNLFKNVYKSQFNLPIYRFKLIECLNGALINKYSAEAFIIEHYDKWEEKIKIHSNNENIKKLNLLKNYLNSLDKLFSKVEKLIS